MKKAVVWYSIRNDEDGVPSLSWFRSFEEAIADQRLSPTWSNTCCGWVETYEGSDVYQRAYGVFDGDEAIPAPIIELSPKWMLTPKS